MSKILIRDATEQDLESIREIYNQEILNGTHTWNHTSMSLTEVQQWFETLKIRNFPIFVAEDTHTHCIVGYANYDQFRSIQGFYRTIEHSVFIRNNYSGQGLGTRLLKHLIQYAQQQDMHMMVACIDSNNTASIQLHHKLGFVQTGYMPQVGEKFGQWLDLVLLQLNLDRIKVLPHAAC